MFGAEYFFETAKLEILPDDPSVKTAGRIWFNLRTKEFKYSIGDNNNKIVIKVLPVEIVLLNLLQDLTSGTMAGGGGAPVSQQITNSPNEVPSSKAVFDAINKTKYKNFALTETKLEYTLVHNLDSIYLQVFAFDQNRISVYPKITIIDANTIKVIFTEATSGTLTVVSYV